MTDCLLVDFQAEEEVITHIRHQVFTLEQSVDPTLDFDGLDKDAVHVLAYRDGTPVGTGRMLNDGHIGRVAVLREHRGSGAGAAILKTLISAADKSYRERIYLYAQVNAVPFYEKLGFTPRGENFVEAGIEHTPMIFAH